jgi:hypothetical protein
MKRKFFTGIAALLALCSIANAETLGEYVNACRTQLSIPATTTWSPMDCYDADLFAQGGEISDYIGYRKVTDQVDYAFICRWLKGTKTAREKAISVESTLHNRQNGQTCYFSAIDSLSTNAESKVSPMVVSPLASNASSYWTTPADVDQNVRCINCHVSGVYLATPRIVPYLAKYGLMNNGHDTLSNVAASELSLIDPTNNEKYRAVITSATSAFVQWNRQKHAYLASNGCSDGCHLVGADSPQQADIQRSRRGPETVLPGFQSIMAMINNAGAMAPYQWDSHYRWINLDTAGDGAEKENFADAMNATKLAVPYLALPANFDGSYCPTGSVPSDMEVHAVGVAAENGFSYSGLNNIAEKFRAFNLKDGLVCLNSDQDPNVSCRDFDVGYLCPSGNWTGTFWNHTVNSNGGDDHEERSYSNNAILAACGGKQPIGIRARYFIPTRGGLSEQLIVGPNDRLARMSQYGLTCNNGDQPDGQCSNYTVRYQGCQAKPQTENHRLSDVFTGKYLTATSSTSGAAVKNTASGSTRQTWAIEHVTNTEYVRLKNTTTNTYLNVTSSAESAIVVTSTSSSATSQMWVIEPVVYAPSDFRFRNLGTGKYLTAQDPALAADKANLVIYSQGKNPSWTSQRWVIN